MFNLTIFAERLKELRKETGLSQEKLGEKLEIAHSAIANWERATSSPNLEAVVKLADFFKVTLDYLVGRED